MGKRKFNFSIRRIIILIFVMSLLISVTSSGALVYPRGFKGEQIPLISRIISITETYDRVLNRGELTLKDRKLAAIDVMINTAILQVMSC